MNYRFSVLIALFLFVSTNSDKALSYSSTDGQSLSSQLSDTKRIIVGRYERVKYGYTKKKNNPITKYIFKDVQVVTKNKIKYREKYKLTFAGGVIPTDTVSTSEDAYNSEEEEQGDINAEAGASASMYDDSGHNSLQEMLTAEGISYETLRYGGTNPELVEGKRYIVFLQKKKNRITPIRAVYLINEFDEVMTVSGRPIKKVKKGELVFAKRLEISSHVYENEGVIVGESEGDELGGGVVRGVTSIANRYESDGVISTDAFINKIQKRIGRAVK